MFSLIVFEVVERTSRWIALHGGHLRYAPCSLQNCLVVVSLRNGMEGLLRGRGWGARGAGLKIVRLSI
jgi:hypothetical protein